MSDTETVDVLDCMPIFKRFGIDTRRDMVAREWRSIESSTLHADLNKRTDIEFEVDGRVIEAQMCPLAYCLWREGKIWTTWIDHDNRGDPFERPEPGEIDGAPDSDAIAKQLLGVTKLQDYVEDIPADKLDDLDAIKAEADAFISAWDGGKIADLAAVACLTEPDQPTGDAPTAPAEPTP